MFSRSARLSNLKPAAARLINYLRAGYAAALVWVVAVAVADRVLRPRRRRET